MLNSLVSSLLIPLIVSQYTGTDAGAVFNPSFDDFGPIQTNGKFNYGGKSISWTKGSAAADILNLGDIQQSGVADFTIGGIFESANANPDDISATTLKDFDLLADSSLEQVAEATGNDPDFLRNILIDGSTVKQAIAAGDGEKTLAQTLGIDKPLKDIKAVRKAVIGKLNNWEQQLINKVPWLSAVPLAKYPAQIANTSLAAISLFAKADVILDRAEKGIDNTITGSDKEKTKFNTPCPKARQQACGHIELDDYVSVKMKGKTWINGKHQKVRGGSGALGAVFGYKEPTGRLPFGPGSPFKLVLTETNERTGKGKERASFSAYFNKCAFLAGCTGYNIGPFPLYSVGNDGLVWLGLNPTQFGQFGIGADAPILSSPGSNGPRIPIDSPVGGSPNAKGKAGECYHKKPGTIFYEWPAQGILTSPFGWRGSKNHDGIDVAAPTGTPIVAAEGGTILKVHWFGGYGLTVEMKESCRNAEFLYAHNSRVAVKPGQKVKRGQVIAYMGSTGFSSGPHTHFEIYPNGGPPVDPMRFLKRR